MLSLVVPVNISCTRSEFTILIPQRMLPQLDRESIYLGNPTCAAQLTATSYKILAQFVNCGTASQVTIGPILYHTIQSFIIIKLLKPLAFSGFLYSLEFAFIILQVYLK